MKHALYPGCSLESTSGAYDQSLRLIAERLELNLEEVDDWNCCGASEYHSIDRLAAHAVIARNLARVDFDVDSIIAPCSACYLNLKKTDLAMQEDPVLGDQIQDALAAGGLEYQPGRVRVRHLLEVLYDEVGESAIRERVVRPLSGLRVAPYYGCQIVRPLNGFDDTEHPTKLDEMLGWVGGNVVDYPVKSHCCGGHLTQISEQEALELIRCLLQNAADYRADVIACLCPMCQLNLDAYQAWASDFFNVEFNMPVLFFTQLIGLALGFDGDELGIGREIVPADDILIAIESRIEGTDGG